MILKIHSLLLIFSAFFAFLLVSCTDSEIHSSDIPELSQSIFVISEKDYGEPYNGHAPSYVYFVNINEKLRICGVYAIDSTFMPIDQSIIYYSSRKLTIDNNETNAACIYYSFDQAGVHKITLETIDNLGDTLISHADVYVNTPTSISLQSPPNHYNQVDGDNQQGLELSWTVYGIDPWETSVCIIYGSYFEDEIWDTPLGETDCTQGAMLTGRLNLDTNKIGEYINHNIDNSTIYWGIRAVTKNEYGNLEQAFSNVFSFSTTLENNPNAIIEVPVACMNSQYPEKSQLKGAFISTAGDTLAKFSKIKANSIIRQTLPPQSNVKIVVCDSTQTEFGCNSMTVDLPPSTKTRTDTLFLLDKIKPNMVPTTKELQTISPITFFILDNGSGVNGSKIVTVMNEDTLKTTFDDYTLSIPNNCKKECNLFIYAEDYARNKAPEVYWKIHVNKALTTIDGPYSKMEEQ